MAESSHDYERSALKFYPPFLCLLALLLAAAVPSHAQDMGRVSPAGLPLPLPGAAPMLPDRLRADNPYNLEMTGTWRFRLTYGQMLARKFVPEAGQVAGFDASTYQGANPPQNAFDGSTDSRWCATEDTFPQWVQVDLGKTQRVTGVTLTWENGGGGYACKIEGGPDPKHLLVMADKTAVPGIGNGPVTVTPTDARYVRILVTGNSHANTWASLREVEIHLIRNGQDVVWRPQPSAYVPPPQDAFTLTNFDDSAWNKISVPSNWEMLGYSIPTYSGVDHTVGEYRRVVTVPASYAGRRVFWHFDGALDGTQVYVNGRYAGYHESGYTAWNIDLTGLLRPGRPNLFALRICKQTPSVDCETGDFQCMGGLYRDTSLISVPLTHVSDITVRTSLTEDYRDADLQTILQVTGTPGATVGLTGALVGADGQAAPVRLAGHGKVGADGTAAISMTAFVKAPREWTAETPNLYYVVFQLTQAGRPVERVEQRFGFRQVEVKNNIVLWNGVPIKCTGVCRHDFWADKGFALTDKQWLTDVTMMKDANINAIRTSHYNHAQRFLELCDEKGFYVLDEVPYCWIGDQVKDPKYAPYLLQRAAETLARDKNRPCVLAWSIGNENPPGIDSQMVLAQVKATDPTRPAFVSCTDPADIPGESWEDDHYPGPGDVDRVAANPKWGANFSEHPHIFYQKETQDYDPGASDLWSETLIKTWGKLWNDPTILGSFIWEWQNQGIADKNSDTTTDFWYGPDHLRQENNKGIVSAYRVPKPEWYIVKMVYSKVVVGARTVSPVNGACAVPLTNHYSFTDLKQLTCRWTALGNGDKILQSGVSHIACPPMQSTTATFPAPVGMTDLRLEFDRADGPSVTYARLAATGAPNPTPPAGPAAGGALTAQDAPDALTVANGMEEVVFDKTTGMLRHWRVNGNDLLTGGPVLNLGEAKAGDWGGYYKAAQPPVTANAKVTATPQADDSVQVVTTSDVLSSVGGTPLGTLTCTYSVQPNATLGLSWSMVWTAKNMNLWEEGLKFTVPATYSHMNWWRDSYFTDYPAGHLGEPTGTATATDVLFRASMRNLHWLTLTDTAGAGLTLMPRDQPLIARADPGMDGNTLFASSQVAGPQDFSGSWVSDHDIHANQGQSLSGAFTLRAVAP